MPLLPPINRPSSPLLPKTNNNAQTPRREHSFSSPCCFWRQKRQPWHKRARALVSLPRKRESKNCLLFWRHLEKRTHYGKDSANFFQNCLCLTKNRRERYLGRKEYIFFEGCETVCFFISTEFPLGTFGISELSIGRERERERKGSFPLPPPSSVQQNRTHCAHLSS